MPPAASQCSISCNAIWAVAKLTSGLSPSSMHHAAESAACANANDMDAVGAVLLRLADGDDAVLADPETFSEFEHAVSRLRDREPFLAEAFRRAATNAALRQAFTTVRGSR